MKRSSCIATRSASIVMALALVASVLGFQVSGAQAAGMAVTKTVCVYTSGACAATAGSAATATSGNVLQYTVSFSGATAGGTVTVTDVMQPRQAYLSCQGASTCALGTDGKTVTFTFTNVGSTGAGSATFQTQVTATNGSIANQASATQTTTTSVAATCPSGFTAGAGTSAAFCLQSIVTVNAAACGIGTLSGFTVVGTTCTGPATVTATCPALSGLTGTAAALNGETGTIVTAADIAAAATAGVTVTPGTCLYQIPAGTVTFVGASGLGAICTAVDSRSTPLTNTATGTPITSGATGAVFCVNVTAAAGTATCPSGFTLSGTGSTATCSAALGTGITAVQCAALTPAGSTTAVTGFCAVAFNACTAPATLSNGTCVTTATSAAILSNITTVTLAAATSGGTTTGSGGNTTICGTVQSYGSGILTISGVNFTTTAGTTLAGGPIVVGGNICSTITLNVYNQATTVNVFSNATGVSYVCTTNASQQTTCVLINSSGQTIGTLSTLPIAAFPVGLDGTYRDGHGWAS